MKKKTILSILALLLLCAAFPAWKILGPTVAAPEKKYFFITTGETYDDVKNHLTSEGIISSSFWFEQVANRLDYPSKVKAGRYEIANGMSVLSLVRMLRSGKQAAVNLVITKLRTKENLAQKIAANFECDSTTVINFLNNPDSLQQFQLDSNTVMTAVIPNTYSILWNTSAAKIFRKLFTDQEKFWTDERRKKAATLNMTTQQVYTMASIVEEETNKDEDKGKIASVYINRIKQGQKLGADPTIKFALRNFGLKRIREAHILACKESPYNTYFHAGLPPGPICTPSAKTIDAVLDAPVTNYLYFVARPDWSGLSNFTNDYQEHLKNAKNYQHFLDSVNIK
ncbi:MAG: endolytic transglycosylase MltG [Bacteroidetes bacterium]|nr:endolytic transglycosylase MltG [Bacteroidota bacterium]